MIPSITERILAPVITGTRTIQIYSMLDDATGLYWWVLQWCEFTAKNPSLYQCFDELAAWYVREIEDCLEAANDDL
jgi:hypothetical protein